MMCENPILLTKNLSVKEYPDGLLVPCGKCFFCRLQKRKEFSMRLLHELDYWDKSMFVTLTYQDKYLPHGGSLKKKDLQNFFKRLRKDGHKIKYYASGEYGTDNTYRPHYHIILFGLGLDQKQIIIDNWNMADWQQLGSQPFGLVEPESIKYVTEYIGKGNEIDKQMYEEAGYEAPFKVQSQGLGLQYALDNKKQIAENGYISHRGIKHSVPRYYAKKLNLNIDQNKLYAEIKDSEILNHYTGVYQSTIGHYKSSSPAEVLRVCEARKKAIKTAKRTIQAKKALKGRKI